MMNLDTLRGILRGHAPFHLAPLRVKQFLTRREKNNHQERKWATPNIKYFCYTYSVSQKNPPEVF